MRNLKRVLSLAMAAAMLIGMMVISAGAASTYEDFTDKGEITNTEAVKTMVSLGVINGKDDGSYFDPDGIVTRAEMAALIARCLNGGVDPSLGDGASTTTFSDTKGHWAEPYIAYCANLGIINGKGDGTFGPDETVTGTAAAKMFLCALGYRSDIEKLTGPGWDLNTDSKANEVGLYANLGGLTPSSGLNRDNTAQLIYNGVQANMVVYRNNYGEYSGVITSQPVNGPGSTDSTMLDVRFGVVKVEGVVEGNEFFTLDGAPQREGKTRLNILKKTSYGDVNEGVTFNVTTSADLIGQKVVLYVKPSSKLSPNPASDKVLGDAIVANSNKVVTTDGRYTDYTTTTFNRFLSNNGMKVVTPSATVAGTESYINYESKTPNIDKNLRGTELTAIDYNDDGVVDYLLAIERTLARVSVYNTNKNELTLSNGDKYDFDDVIGINDIASNDYVLYFEANGKAYAEVSEPVTATLESYVAYSSVTLDGTTYNMAYAGGKRDHTHLEKISDLTRFNNANNTGAHPMNTEMGVPKGSDAGEMELGDSYDLYLDKAGNIIAYEPADMTAGNYALVLETVRTTDSMNSNPEGRVSLLLADGTRVSGNLDMEGTQKNFERADSSVSTPRAFAEKYVNKYFDLYETNGDLKGTEGTAGDSATADTSRLAGTIVTYSETNGTYVLKPTNMISDASGNAKVWKANANSGTVGATTTVTGAVVKNMPSVSVGGQRVITNENTVFLFANGEFDTEKTTAIQGVSGLSSTAIPTGAIKAVAYNERTNVARVVYVNADSGTSSSNYSFVDKSATVRSIDGTTRYVYDSVNKDGEHVELITNIQSLSNGSGIYKVTTDSKGISSLTAATATTDESTYLDSIVAGATFNSVVGRIDSIDGGVITVKDDNSRTFPLNVSGLEGVYVDDASAPSKVSLSVGQMVAVSFKKDNSKAVVESVFVTELFSDEIQPYAAAPVVTVKSGTDKGLTMSDKTLAVKGANDAAETATATGFADTTVETIDVTIAARAGTVVESATLTVGGTDVPLTNTPATTDGSRQALNIDMESEGAKEIRISVTVKGAEGTQARTQTYTYKLDLTVSGAPDTYSITVNGTPDAGNHQAGETVQIAAVTGATKAIAYYVNGGKYYTLKADKSWEEHADLATAKANGVDIKAGVADVEMPAFDVVVIGQYDIAAPTQAAGFAATGGITALANNSTATEAWYGEEVVVKFTTTGDVSNSGNPVVVTATVKTATNSTGTPVTKSLADGTTAGDFETAAFTMPGEAVTAIELSASAN